MGEAPHVTRQRTEHAREELASDLHALTEKLNVKKQVDRKRSEVVDNVKGALGMRDSHGTTSNSEVGAVASSVRSNPLAVLALGYGAKTLFGAWQARHAQHDHSHVTGTTTTYGSSPLRPYEETGDGGSKVGDAKEKVADVAGSAKAAVTSKVDDLKGTADDLAGTARTRAHDMSDAVGEQVSVVQAKVGDATSAVTRVAPTSMPELERMVRTNLPAFGIAAVAAGAIAGLLLPRTKLENERLGEVRDQLVGTVQERALEAKDAVQHGLLEAKDVVQVGLEEGLQAAKSTTKEDLGIGEGDAATTDTEPVQGTDVSSDSDDLLIQPLAGMSSGVPSGDEEKRPGRITGLRGTAGTTGAMDAPQSTPVGSDLGSP